VAQEFEGDTITVVADHAIEVADAKRHGAHAGVSGQQTARRELIGCSHN
jgi:hypothetical protein